MNVSGPRISIVVPCYNESANIKSTIAAIENGLHAAGVSSYEIVVVDDCSRDATAAIVNEVMKTDPGVMLVRNPSNLGFGGAYKVGLKKACGQYVIMVPGDNAFPSDSIADILRKAGEADIVVPYFRDTKARHASRRIISRAFTCLMNVLFRMRLPYFNGPVLHRGDFLQGIEIKTDGFAFQAEGLIKLIKAGATYTTVAVDVAERSEGRSSALRPTNVYRVVQTLPRLWLEVRRSNQSAQAMVTRLRESN